jgi:plastocyanin
MLIIVVVSLTALVAFVVTNTFTSLPATAQAKPKVFQVTAVEWKTTLGKADPYPTLFDRGTPLTEGKSINRYAWDPAFIVVKTGDKVVLKIHTVNGNAHDIDIPGIDFKITARSGVDGKGKAPIASKPVIFTRGEEITVEFTAGPAGLYEILCSIHDEGYASKDRPELKDDAGVVLDGAKKRGDAIKGPMVGYLLVLP